VRGEVFLWRVEALKGQSDPLVVGSWGRQPEPLGDAVDVGVHGEGGPPGAEEEEDVGGLRPHPRQAQKGFPRLLERHGVDEVEGSAEPLQRQAGQAFYDL